uniref:Uncharacterized protein n=1 Tax=Panagrolaimus superbus TaxID=310955 RepID=A0A914YIT2_9BILA
MVGKSKILKNSLVECVYVSTVQPVEYSCLSSLVSSFSPHSSLDEACKNFGFYSFNEYLRRNHKLFDSFLTLFVCKNPDVKDNENPFILYYYNTEGEKNSKFRSNFVEHQSVDLLRVGISYKESIFFESHNSLKIIDRRKEFVQLVEYCQTQGRINAGEMVPLDKIKQAFRQKYGNEELSNKMETWFPNRGSGIENIVQKVLFEDLNFTLSDQTNRKEIEFRLKEGWTEKNFDQHKRDLQGIKDKIECGLSLKNPTETAEDSKYNDMDAMHRFLSVPSQKPSGIFGCSSDEEDLRVENQPFKEGSTRKPYNGIKTTQRKKE